MLRWNARAGPVHLQSFHGGNSGKFRGRRCDEYFHPSKERQSTVAFKPRLGFSAVRAVVAVAWDGTGLRAIEYLRCEAQTGERAIHHAAGFCYGGSLFLWRSQHGRHDAPGGNQPVIYNITVTGTSAGTAPDAGQSVQVILVVN